MNGREFADEYRALRDQGLDHDRIADRLGVQRDSLMRRLSRNGVPYLPEPDERRVYQVLETLIESGRVFDARDLPDAGRRSVHGAALGRALHAGRVEVVGVVRCPDPLRQFRAVAQNGEAAA